MRKKRRFFLICIIAISTSSFAQNNQGKYWIYFKDKGPLARAKANQVYREAVQRLTDRAIERRLKVRPPERLIDETDLAVYPGYIAILRQNGIQPVVLSRWLNAVSAYLSQQQIKQLGQLDFVAKILRVRKLAPPRPVARSKRALPRRAKRGRHAFNYGLSLRQNELVKVPILHDAGIFAEGVIVGMLDTGFNYADNPAFQSLQVLGQFDFVFNDSVTADEPGKDVKGQESHGTETLSVIAGFDPGNLIGPAFKAQFCLSKTEDIRSETPVEEDFWMAGIEWMEAQGIDVASSSLGYRDFDNPEYNHTYDEMDGRTTVVTRAAQMAASRGVVVVNSAGNEGATSWRYFIAPADGFDVIAVGATDSSGIRAGFSSIGPTVDGRIKPDVMAMGVGVVLARPGSQFPYATGSGTSFSCPMVAGIVAQILSAHPELTPQEVMEALHKTSSQASNPDNQMGFGVVDARKAITYWGPAFSNRFSAEIRGQDRLQIQIRVLSAPGVHGNSAFLFWRKKGEISFQSTKMYFADSTLLRSEWIPYQQGTDIELYFAVEVPGKGTFEYPHNAPNALFALSRDGNILPPSDIPESYEILQNYPNPFRLSDHSLTSFRIRLPEPATVRVTIYNILGQKITQLISGKLFSIGTFTINWDGRYSGNLPVPAGIYFFNAEFQQDDGRKVIKHKKFAVIR